MSTSTQQIETYAFWKAIREQVRAEREKKRRRVERRAKALLPSITFDRAGRPKSRAELQARRAVLLDLIGSSKAHRKLMREAARAFDALMAREAAARHHKSTKPRRLKPMTVDSAQETRSRVA